MLFMPKSLGQALKALRMRTGLSQYALAAGARVDQAILSRLETGTRNGVSVEVLCSLSEALGVTVDELLVEAGFKSAKGKKKASPSGQRAALEQKIGSTRRLLKRAMATLDDITL
jgi:transcriptional regulator with XRE-family HTH domain